MDSDVQRPTDKFECLRCFLRSVAHVNLITAWLYSISFVFLLWLIGSYDKEIYQGSTTMSYINILNDFVIQIMMQAFLRTLIGLHHYERTPEVEAHRIEQEQQSYSFSDEISSTRTLLRKRANTRNNKALIAGLVIAFVAIVAHYNDIYTGVYRIPAEVRKIYVGLVIWLLVLEALMNCPKRHMKVTAVATNFLAICILVLLKWKSNWKVQNYPHFEESLTYFLPFIELRMVCLMSAFFLCLSNLTLLQTNNWPLPSLEMRMKQAITVALVALLVVSAVY
jgi:hypothetical protein